MDKGFITLTYPLPISLTKDVKKPLKRYEYYYPALEKLAKFRLDEHPQINELELPRGLLQTAYKETKKLHEIEILDLFCNYSMFKVILDWEGTLAHYVFDLMRKKNGYNIDLEKHINITFKIFRTAMLLDKINGKNLLRLFQRNPLYLIVEPRLESIKNGIKRKHIKKNKEDKFELYFNNYIFQLMGYLRLQYLHFDYYGEFQESEEILQSINKSFTDLVLSLTNKKTS